MKFNTNERLLLLSICINYQKNNIPDLISYKLVLNFIDNLGFDQNEIDKLNFNFDAKEVNWNRKEDRPKEIKVSNQVKRVVKQELTKYDKKKQLNFLKHFSLCEKFGYEPKLDKKGKMQNSWKK